MRLQTYINEEELYTKYIPKMKKDCAKFIKDIRGAKGSLIRTDNKKQDWNISYNKTREIRKPTDTPKKLNNKIDKLFKKKFGWNARTKNVVFCWGRSRKLIGRNARYVFPVGNYKYLWSTQVDDLYRQLYLPVLHKNMGTWTDAEDSKEAMKVAYDNFEDNLIDTYTNKNLEKGILSNNEIMVGCKYYYLVSYMVIKEVNEELDLRWNFI